MIPLGAGHYRRLLYTALAAVDGEKITVPAKGPYMEDLSGFYEAGNSP
jgi:hypothetical protein